MAVLLSQKVEAQIPGKTYQPGDSIILDGMICLVYKVDDSGMHGSAMSPRVADSKHFEKTKKNTIKYFEKEIKKGNAIQADLDVALMSIEKASKLPQMEVTKKHVYKVDEWTKLLPNGWRIPSSDDANDFATFYCGGLGKDYAIKVKFLMKATELTKNPLLQDILLYISQRGMIISDSCKPEDVKFMQRYQQKMSMKDWFQIDDLPIGNEQLVAVKDF